MVAIILTHVRGLTTPLSGGGELGSPCVAAQLIQQLAAR